MEFFILMKSLIITDLLIQAIKKNTIIHFKTDLVL